MSESGFVASDITGTRLVDIKTGYHFGLCPEHLAAWKVDYPERFDGYLELSRIAYGGWFCPANGGHAVDGPCSPETADEVRIEPSQDEVARYERLMQAAFDAEAEHRDCCCGDGVNLFCKRHNQP